MSRAGDAIYRAFLRAFPKRFREARADEMTRLFQEQRRSVAGRPLAIARLWWLASRDAISEGLRARMRAASVTESPAHRMADPAANATAWAFGQPLRDVRLAIRVLGRTPVPTLVAVLALGLGIGVNAAIFSVIHELLVDPLHYPHAERVVLPWQWRGDGLALSPRIASVDRWRNAKSLDAIVTYSSARVAMDDGGTATLVQRARIEPGLLDFTGSRVVAGRPFTAADVESDITARVALLGDALWTSRFGRDRAVIGRTIALDDVPHEIVGVLPPSFRLPLDSPDLVTPLVKPRPAADGSAVQFPIGTMARLAPGVTTAAAEAEMTSLAKDTVDPASRVYLRSGPEMLGGPVRDALLVLLAAVACVLLIACANVAHVLLARNVARHRELSVRAALGATGGRLFRQLMTEYLVLASAAGLFGAFVAWLSIEALVAWRPTDIQSLAFIRAGALTYAVSFALAILTGVSVGLLPAWAAARSAVSTRRTDGTRISGDARGRTVRRVLNVAEVALALMLLSGAGLLVRSYLQLASRDLGFDPARTIALEVELGRTRYPTPAAKRAFIEPLAAAVRKLADVDRVAMTVLVPPRGGLFFTALEVEGSSKPPIQTPFDGGIVSAGFFETLRVPIVEGRGFVEDDGRESRPVLVVSQRTAAMLWPDGPAVGRRARLGPTDPWSTVVGVAGDVTSRSSGKDRPQIYMPMTAQYDDAPTLIVRTRGDVDGLIAAVRAQVTALDPRVAISSLRTLESDVREVNVRPRFNALLLGLLAAIGLILAVTGIYGVINYSVGLRTRELGVRVALGASPAALGRSVIREAALVGLAGIAIGLSLWPLVGKGLASLLVGLGSTDAPTLAAVSALLMAATVLAAWLPARRAVRTDPVSALRAET